MKVTCVWLAGLVAISTAGGCERTGLVNDESTKSAPSATLAASAKPPFSPPPTVAGMPDIATLVERVNPSVVNITTIHEVRQPTVEPGVPFDFFFGPMAPPGPREPRGRENTLRQRALGSGFIIDTDGRVVTNAHVVDRADQVRVRLADEREVEATVVGRDPRLDLAVLQMNGAKDLHAVTLGSSEALRVGEHVVAIGNPFGLGHTVTIGIVSAKGRALGAGPYDDFIQTDASINPGNSGGPLFNLKGEVVGINTAMNPRAQGIGFATPVDALKDVLPQLVQTGHVARGRVGALVQPVDEAMAKALGLDRPKGALVAEVEPDGPAAKGGLKSGDVILRVGDTEIAHSSDLPRIVARRSPGTRVPIVVLRDRAERTFDVTLDQLKEERAERDSNSSDQPTRSGLGIELADRRNEVVVQAVRPGSIADGHFEAGDVILEVNHVAVGNAADITKRVEKAPAGNTLLFKVRRNGHTLFIALDRTAG
jgi:serine protease Do